MLAWTGKERTWSIECVAWGVLITDYVGCLLQENSLMWKPFIIGVRTEGQEFSDDVADGVQSWADPVDSCPLTQDYQGQTEVTWRGWEADRKALWVFAGEKRKKNRREGKHKNEWKQLVGRTVEPRGNKRNIYMLLAGVGLTGRIRKQAAGRRRGEKNRKVNVRRNKYHDVR